MEQVKAEPVELKPCPFCGGEARCSENWPTWDTREWAAYCYDDCGCVVSKRTVAEAIAAWNTRAPESPSPPEAAMKRIAELEARLEVAPGWSESADGISCRDHTIKLQDKRIADLDKYRLMLLDLLAVIHRDGGQKTQEIGVKLAHEQAMQLSSERIKKKPGWWTETPLYATPQPAAVDGLVALLKRAEIFANTARSFDWNEDRCAMTAIHLAGDIRQALAQIERTEDGNG